MCTMLFCSSTLWQKNKPNSQISSTCMCEHAQKYDDRNVIHSTGIILLPIRWWINSPGPDCNGSTIPPSLISECSLMLYIEQQPQPPPRKPTLWPLTWIPLPWLASRQKMQQYHWLHQVDAQPGTQNKTQHSMSNYCSIAVLPEWPTTTISEQFES